MKAIDELVSIIEKLRNPDDGCPWDLKQTPETLKEYIIEEAYELIEAIEFKDNKKIMEESGDLLLQIVLLSQMFKEKNIFDLSDIAVSLKDKLVRRHPHVFGDFKVNSAEEVKANWEKIKKKEKNKKSILSDYPASMPSLQVSKRISEQASSVGFDWNDPLKALEKVEEEIAELKVEIIKQNKNACFEETGDLIFAIANVSRLLEINPDIALKSANEKFKSRFRFIEEYLSVNNRDISKTSLEELEALWNEAKTREE
jgi:MazG family protein